jgi:hypothetical protein
MNENHESPLSPAAELALAQQRLADAKRKIELLEEARLQKLRQELADRAADEERRRFQQAEEQRLIEQRWLEKKRCEDERREAERRGKEAARRELEQSLTRAEEEHRQRQQHEKEMERLANEAFLLEQEAQRREAELYARNTVVKAANESNEENGRKRLFCHLTKPARRFDGHDGHAEEAPIRPTSREPSEGKE